MKKVEIRNRNKKIKTKKFYKTQRDSKFYLST